MSASEKEPYTKAYEHEKEIFDKLNAEYIAVHGKETREKKGKESKSKPKAKKEVVSESDDSEEDEVLGEYFRKKKKLTKRR